MIATTDSWQNLTTGVGGPSDKSAGFTFVGGHEWLWDHHRLSDLYEVDDIAAAIVDAVVDESFMRDWSLKVGDDEKQAQAARDWFDAIGGTNVVKQARKWARLHGGAGIYLGSDDASQTDPLKLGGRLHFATPYEASELIPTRWYSDPLKPNFGEVSHYHLTPTTRAAVRPIVHESRIVLFNGVSTTKMKRELRQGWGASALIRPIKAISQFHATFATVQALLADSSQNVYKWKGLADLLLAGRKDIMTARMALFDEVRSAIKAIVVDADNEDFVRSQLQLSGVEGIMDKFMSRVAGAAKMPVSKVFGEAPAGLSATGESDHRNWNNQVAVEQREELEPAMDKICRVMFHAKNGPTAGVEPDSWKIKWPSLWEPTPTEEADINAKNATTDQIYFDMGALTAQQIARVRFTASDSRQITLNEEEIAAIEPPLTETGGEVGSTMPAAESVMGELPLDVDVDTSDTDTGDTAIESLASKMTEYAVPRCEHGVVNRCLKCGIERIRDFEVDESGQPLKDPEGNLVWRVLWRPIVAAKAAPEIPAA